MRPLAVLLLLSGCAVPAPPVEPHAYRVDALPPAMVIVDDNAVMGTLPAGAVPTAFQGEWRADPAHCGASRDESSLWIGADAIRYYESHGRIHSAIARDDTLALITELTGEGQPRLATDLLRLSPDGQRLTRIDASDRPLVRRRCPMAS